MLPYDCLEKYSDGAGEIQPQRFKYLQRIVLKFRVEAHGCSGCACHATFPFASCCLTLYIQPVLDGQLRSQERFEEG